MSRGALCWGGVLSQDCSVFPEFGCIQRVWSPHLEAKVSLGLGSPGFVSHHFAPNARQDDDEGDQCSQKDGDDDGQGSVH